MGTAGALLSPLGRLSSFGGSHFYTIIIAKYEALVQF
jgi:hypothetical protein